MTLLLVYATVSIFFSFLCSILEAVLLSVTPTFINIKKKAGFTYADILQDLKKDVDKPLIAILTLNTIAHTVGAILVGVEAEKLPYKIEFLGWLLQLTTRLIGNKGHGSILSREGFMAMTEMAEQEGVFQESESKVIKNLLSFKEVRVKDIMTPRAVLKSADEEQTIQAFFDEHPMLRFSRIPIYEGNPDNITGYFLKDQLLEAIIKGNGEQPLKNIKTEE